MLKLRFDTEEKNDTNNNTSSHSSSSSSSESDTDKKIDTKVKKSSSTKHLTTQSADHSDTPNLPIYQDFMPDNTNDDETSNVLVDLEGKIEKILEKLLAAKNKAESLPSTSTQSAVKKPIRKQTRTKRARSESVSSVDSNSADDSGNSGDEDDDVDEDEPTSDAHHDDVTMGGKKAKKSNHQKKEKKVKAQKQKKTKCSSSSNSKTLAQVNKALVGIQKKVNKALEKKNK